LAVGLFYRGRTIGDLQVHRRRVPASDLDQLGRRVDCSDFGPQPREWFGEKARTAADVERTPPLQRRSAVLVERPMLVDHVADIFEPYRIQLVKHRLGPVWVPPVAGMGGELLDLFRDDACFRSGRALARA